MNISNFNRTGTMQQAIRVIHLAMAATLEVTVLFISYNMTLDLRSQLISADSTNA